MMDADFADRLWDVIVFASGIVLGRIIGWFDEWRRMSRTSFELEKEAFERSVRVSVLVRNEGSHYTISNAVCSLDIETEPSLEEIAVPKRGGRCIYAGLEGAPCSGLDYLADPKVGVKCEPLPWAAPLPAGTGLDGLSYCHVTTIPAKSGVRVRLFDVYRVKVYSPIGGGRVGLTDEFCLIKVHSEYGVEKRPRICIKLGKNRECKVKFRLRLGGEHLRGRRTCEVTLIGNLERLELAFNGVTVSEDLIKDMRETIDLMPRGGIY